MALTPERRSGMAETEFRLWMDDFDPFFIGLISALAIRLDISSV
jgi:hypothetical protein